MDSNAPYNSRFSADQYPYVDFGIIGGFPGDVDLEREIEWCRQAFLSASAHKPPLARLVALLTTLPLKGRNTVVRKIIAPSPHRDAILRDLFDYCFQPDDDEDAEMTDASSSASSLMVDEDFVIIANPTSGDTPEPLNLNRHHIFQPVIVLMALSGKAGVEACRQYLRSASTRYRAKVLIQCATTLSNEDFSDEDLWQAYSSSPDSVQQKIIEACKQSGRRVAFLQRVYEDGLGRGHSQNLILWLESNYLAPELEGLIKDNKDFKMKRWGVHGEVYINYIRKKMEACSKDCLKLGQTWSEVEQRIELHSIKPAQVYQLLEIFAKYKPYRVKRRCAKDVTDFLKDLSAKGEDLSVFEQVERLFLPHTILKKLTKQERVKLVLKAYESHDWDSFEWLKELVPVKKLPHKEIFAEATSDDLWMLLSRKKCVSPFFGYSSNMVRRQISTPYERAAIIKSWADLHLRFKPSDLSAEQMSKFEFCSLTIGSVWHQSYCWYLDAAYTSHVVSVIKEESKSPFLLNSRLVFYAQHLKELVEIAVKGMNTVAEASTSAPLSYESPALMEPLFQILRNCSYEEIQKCDVVAERDLCRHIVEVIVGQVTPRLDNVLHFDPSDLSTYVTDSSLKFFRETCSFLVEKWAASEKVGRSIASLLLEVMAHAIKERDSFAEKVPRFIIATDVATKRRRVAYLNATFSQQAASICLENIKNLLRRMKSGGLDFSFSNELWSKIVEVEKDVSTYLSNCQEMLPDRLLEAERSSMIERSREFILIKYKESPFRWKDTLSSFAKVLSKLGILESVLLGDDIPEKVHDLFQRDHAGFGNEKVKQILKDATFAADGDSRAAGLISWLDKAFETSSLSQIASAMSFAASRIKNESGSHRRTVFTWLKDNFVPRVVELSLRDEGADLGVHEKLSSIIVLVQQNDLSRLDCVGRMVCFPQLPSLILNSVLTFDPSKLKTEVRQVWSNCAIRLHWTLEQATNGDESLRCYTFPSISIQNLESASWVSLEHLKAAYPLTVRGNAEKLSTIGQRGLLSSSRLRKGFDKNIIFGPKQCVDMLSGSLATVWSDDFPCPPLHIESSFPEDEDVASALYGRIEFMLRLCDTAWQEVEALTTTFDNVFSNLETVSDTHFENASELLEGLIRIHGHKYAMQVPRIARACDMIFRCAVSRSKSDYSYIVHWFNHWKTLYLDYGNHHWGSISDERFRHLILKHSNVCCPKGHATTLEARGYCHLCRRRGKTHDCRSCGWAACVRCRPIGDNAGLGPNSRGYLLTKTDEVLRRCVVSRELLTMSTSALVLEDVRSVLFTSREDIFLHYSKGLDCLKGPFTCFEEYDSIDSLLFQTVKVGSLVGLSAATCRRYAHFALEEAADPQKDLRSKTDAMKKFMDAPTTQHSDVLEALQRDLEDAVREVLINRVFLLDSPWHILGFLLSQSAIEKNDQRVTAALLGYVAQHVHVSKVVKMIAILLKNPRRKKLSFQLHKAVVRMLFDAEKTDGDAERLLRVEWESDLSIGVRDLMVEKCMQLALSGKTDGWEASIVFQVATDKSLELETKFYLFSPRFASTDSLSIPIADECEKSELLDTFRQKGTSSAYYVDSIGVANFFYSVFQKLEQASDGSLQVLAKCKRLSLARLFGAEHRNDQGVLDEMFQMLTTPLEWNHDNQVLLAYVSHLFAAGVALFLNRTLKFEVGTNSIKDIAQACEQSDVAIKFKYCVRVQLNELLDLPVRKVSRRKQLLNSLQEILTTLDNNEGEWHLKQILFRDPFKSELKLLEGDISLVTEMVEI